MLRVPTLPFETLDALGAPDSIPGLEELIRREAQLEAQAHDLTVRLHDIAGARPQEIQSPEAWRARNAVLALRRDVHNLRGLRPRLLEEAGSLIPPYLRSELVGFHDAHAQWTRDHVAWETVYASETLREKAALLGLFRHPEFVESVWLASRSLGGALEKLPRRAVAEWRNEETHAALKLLAYLVRAATKTSPNTLFAATAGAHLADVLRVRGSAALVHARVRFNVSEARKITACLAVDSVLKPIIRPRLNPTAHRQDDIWRWWKPASARREDDDEVLMETATHGVLEGVLDATAERRSTLPELVDLVASNAGVPLESAERYVETLVDRGLIMAEVDIPALESRPLRFMAQWVKGESCHPEWARALEHLEDALDSLPSPGSPERRRTLAETADTLDSLPHVRPLVRDELFRVDAVSGFDVTLPRAIPEELGRAVDAYLRVFAGLYPFTRRDAYARLFLEQFPADVDIPVLELYERLDEPETETALGALPRPQQGLGPLENCLLAGERDGASEVRLHPDAFLERMPSRDPGRWMAGVLFQVAMRPGADPLSSDTRLVINALFHGCGLALARFHDLHPGSGIAETLRAGWSSLVPAGALPAEIAYLPWGRTANASLRPRLFDHEIELLGESASPGAQVLSLNDLFVRYERATRRFHLCSRSRNCEVIPFLSSGVRPRGFAAFLVHIGTQELFPVAFFPGLDLPDVVHWPRLTLDRVVLFRERWVFGQGNGPQGRESPGALWFEHLQIWRRKHRVPRRVFAASARHGKPFYVDLESPLMTELLRRFLISTERSDRCILAEMMPGPETLWLRDPGGGYASEFLVELEGPSQGVCIHG